MEIMHPCTDLYDSIIGTKIKERFCWKYASHLVLLSAVAAIGFAMAKRAVIYCTVSVGTFRNRTSTITTAFIGIIMFDHHLFS